MALPALFLCCCAYVLPMRAPPGALAHVSATQVVMKNLDTFDELAGAVKSYLSTIEPAALNDPEAPSPLAYLELRNAGRTDLVEGIMKHGGYFAVSKKLGVRVKDVVAPPPKVNPWTSQLVEEKPDVAVSLSASAKEDKMAADLARLASGTAASAVAPSSTVVGVARGDQLTPIPVRRPGKDAASAAGKSSSSPAVKPAISLDGFQRAELALLLALLAVGYGRTTAEVLEPTAIATVQLCFAALTVGHLVISVYGTVVAARAPADQAHSPPLWFLKLAATGAGGLRELQRAVSDGR